MQPQRWRTAAAGLGILLAGVAAQADSIKWSKSLSAAMTEAKRTKKLVMIDFYTDW